ncbi:LapA family protein [Rhodococcoides corynebacterioides]|uniref:LapA family protein n=1 Tax=Rhodococcoides corynebacterioides TaxID=53972 RepID=UPI003F808930
MSRTSPGAADSAASDPTDPTSSALPGSELDSGGSDVAVSDSRLPAGKTPDGVKHTRAAALYTGLVVGAIVLVVLMVFILQNLDSVPIHLFGWTFDLPVGIGMLLAAVAGALVMAAAGGVRILQVRRAAKRK